MRRAALIAAALALGVFPGCGGEEESGQSSSSTSQTDAATRPPDPAGPLTAADAAEIQDVIRTWLTEGGCQYMTDDFLETQTFIDEPAEACDQFEKLFDAPSFDADDVIVSDIRGTPAKASALISDDFSNVRSTYRLVTEGDDWKIDSTDIK